MSKQAAIALSRFGLGARPGERKHIAADPRGWVLSRLQAPADDATATAGRPDTRAISRRFAALWLLKKRAKDGEDIGAEAIRAAGAAIKADSREEILVHLRQAAVTDNPVKEKLVRFWANHFTVSSARPRVAPIVGAYEREVIRPNIGGRFYDLLLAAESHPAMILFLDNHKSKGPNSAAGRRLGMGLNENLAREILELHTLGVDGGYSQADVTEFAKALTGWTIRLDTADEDRFGRFFFHPRSHEPGPRTVLGKTYRESGEAQARAVLRDLGRHPSTARFVATKLVRHFVADIPPPAAVARVAGVFTETDGDLNEVHKATFTLAAAWSTPLRKARAPVDYVVAVARALGAADRLEAPVIEILAQMGQKPHAAPGPDGWPDTAADWINGQGVMRRIEWAGEVAGRVHGVVARDMLHDLYGPLLSDNTGQAIRRAGNGAQALTLALASPEMMYC